MFSGLRCFQLGFLRYYKYSSFFQTCLLFLIPIVENGGAAHQYARLTVTDDETDAVITIFSCKNNKKSIEGKGYFINNI